MPGFLTPGVYRLPRPTEPRDIRLVRTDVAGFVGFSERGPLPRPGVQPDPKELAVRLTSWKDFVTTFGWFIPNGVLAYAVRAFFENGGTTCYVVRVAATNHRDASKRPSAASYPLPDGSPALEIGHSTEVLAKGQSKLCDDIHVRPPSWRPDHDKR